MKRRRNILIIIAAALAIIVIGAIAARPKAAPIVVTTQTVHRMTFETRLPETGNLQRPQTQTLAALVSGNLGAFLVKPGDHVATGQLLATIVNPQITNAAVTARAAYDAAAGRASSAVQTNAVLPAQNRSSVVQAEAALEQARFNLNQARQDVRSGSQSGLGYGGSSAAEQRTIADATVAKARSDAREAARIAAANIDLFNNKAISRDTLEQSRARDEQARVTLDQAQRQRDETYAQLARQAPVLDERVAAAQDSVRQAEAALSSARASAAQNKTGDVTAAQSDAQARYADWQYAQDQVARLEIRAPFAGTILTLATQATDSLRTLQPGDSIAVGSALITIAADDNYVVRTKVDEQDVATVHTGDLAEIGGEDLAGKKLPGHVIAVNAVAQKSDDPSNTSRQVLTTIRLDRSLPFLRDGMTVDVDIITRRQRDAIVIANDAIRRDADNKPYVLLLKNGKAAKTSIVAGTANETQTIVASGVSTGDVVITDRNPGIVDGSSATPMPQPSTSPKAIAAGR